MTSNIKFITPNWPAPLPIKAYTSLRQPDKKSIFPPNKEDELVIKAALNLPNSPIWLTQIHGKALVEAIPANIQTKADASFSRHSHQVCAILTADCLPILLCNRQATLVAAIHAGCRGLALGIIENVIQQLQQPVNDYLVWLGPAIGSQHFEVGKDVYETFIQINDQLKSAFTYQGQEKWLADIYLIAKIKLNKLGIQHIYGGEYCTYSQETLFYSYRRDKANTGRMASLIWIEAP